MANSQTQRYHRQRSLLQLWLKHIWEARARLGMLGFVCRSLSGESGHSITINCDLTVSCHCSDYTGRGILGDLRENDFGKLLDGPTARERRAILAAGRLPIPECASCPSLRALPSKEAKAIGKVRWPIAGILVENTIECGLACLSCPRSLVAAVRRKRSMDLDDIHLVADRISQARVSHISFYNLGEPFASPLIGQELSIVKNVNPRTRIEASTNGLYIENDQKREAALLLDGIHFSIDGIDDQMVSRYQKGGSFRRAYGNMRNLVEYRKRGGHKKPDIEWKYVLFRWNDRRRHLQKAIRLARQAGVDRISFWPARFPLQAASWRWLLPGYFSSIGEPSWKGREVVFVGERPVSG